ELGRAGPGGSDTREDRAHDSRARGTRAPAERESDSAGGAGDPKKGGSLLREGAAVRFSFIAAEQARHSLSLLCRCMQVARSGFYAWRRRSESPPLPARRDRRLKVLVQASF